MTYFSYQSQQKVAETLANKLLEETDKRINQTLQSYLDTPEKVDRLNAAAIEQGTLNARNSSQLERHFAQHLNIFPSLSEVAIATEQKEFLAIERLSGDIRGIRRLDASTAYKFHRYSATNQGQKLKLLEVQRGFDPPNRPWYQEARQATGASWSVVSLAQGQEQPRLMVANFLPFRDAANQFQGVVSSSLYLFPLEEFLRSLKIGSTGQAFIIDRDGYLVITSTGESPFEAKPEAGYARNVDLRSRRLKAINSHNLITRKVTAFLFNQSNVLSGINQQQYLRLNIDRDSYFIQVTPLRLGRGLDWLTVTIVPKSDFMTETYHNTSMIVLLSAGTVLGSILLSLMLSRWLTKPILQLSAAAKRIALGDFNTRISSNRRDELGELARSFDAMLLQVNTAFAGMRSLNQAVSESEQRLAQILETLPIAVSMHRLDGTIAYLNPSGKQLLGGSEPYKAAAKELAEAYQLYRSGTEHLYQTDEFPIVRSLQGERVIVDDIEMRRNGERIQLEVHSAPVFDSEGSVISAIAVFQDITQRKITEKILFDHNQHLETQVAERTQALQASEVLNRTIRHALPDPVLRMKRDGTYLDVTVPSSFPLVNAEATVLGSNVNTVLSPETAKYHLAMIEQALQTNIMQIYEAPFLVNQESRWQEIRIVPLTEDEVLVIIRDISEQKHYEKALKQSEERFRAIFNQTLQYVGLLAPDGALLEVNQTALNFGGLQRDDVVGKPFWEARWWALSNETQQQLKTAIARAATGGFIRYEVDILGAGNRIATLDFSLRPLFDETGEVKLLILEGRDITARKRAEEALRQSEARNRAILAAIPDLMSLISQDGIYLDSIKSNARMDLIPRDVAPVGKHLNELLPAEEAARKLQVIQQAIAKQEVQTYEQKVWIDNRWQYEELRVVPYSDRAALLMIRDITIRKQVEQELQASLQREQAIARMIDRVYRKLDLRSIFETTVQELRQVMHGDRLVIYRFNEDWSGHFVAESVGSAWTSVMNDTEFQPLQDVSQHDRCSVQLWTQTSLIQDSYLQETQGGAYQVGARCVSVENIYQAGFSPCYVELLERLEAKAYIIVPIRVGCQLWGLLAVYQNSSPRCWQETEIQIMIQVSQQLGVAVEQAQLLERTQQQAVELLQAKEAAETAS